MNRLRILIPLAIVLLIFALIIGCDKQRITESSETIHDIQYIELPPDTVVVHDTVVATDSVLVQATDTLMVHDTVVQTNTVYDTIVQTNTIHDTITVTVTVTDTVQTTVIDTLVQVSNSANEAVAMGALQFNVDPLVFDFIQQQFNMTDGWVYYLSSYQSEITQASDGVYDIYGYVDYWAADWSGYYAFEYYYRVTYAAGDPADPNNWILSDPPASPKGTDPGLKLITPDKQLPGTNLR